MKYFFIVLTLLIFYRLAVNPTLPNTNLEELALGVLHGTTSPLMLFASDLSFLSLEHINLYEPNNGPIYDNGFLIGMLVNFILFVKMVEVFILLIRGGGKNK